jgi:hypothetical protein
MTTALEGGEGSASSPGRSLPAGKTRYPLYRRLGGSQGQSGQVRKISPQSGFDPRTVQPVTSHYTDWTTGPTTNSYFLQNKRNNRSAYQRSIKASRHVHGTMIIWMACFWQTRSCSRCRSVAGAESSSLLVRPWPSHTAYFFVINLTTTHSV